MTTGLIPVFTRPTTAFVEFEAGTNPRDLHLNPLKVGIEDIKQWIEARDPKPSRHWNELGREEMSRSFTAARTAGQDVIDDLYFAFYDTVAKGGTEVDFERMVVPTLKAKGWLSDQGGPSIASRVRLIYDTNLRLARASGRWARYKSAKSGLPYLRAVTARDGRVRHPPKSPDSDHMAWDGIILSVDDPFWTRWFPPLGFRCRCSVIQMTRSQLARYPGGTTSPNDLAEREARLGVPVFASPAAGIDATLQQMVAGTNRESTPGSREIRPAIMRQQGSALFDLLQAEEQMKGIESFIERLFGKAA